MTNDCNADLDLAMARIQWTAVACMAALLAAGYNLAVVVCAAWALIGPAAIDRIMYALAKRHVRRALGRG